MTSSTGINGSPTPPIRNATPYIYLNQEDKTVRKQVVLSIVACRCRITPCNEGQGVSSITVEDSRIVRFCFNGKFYRVYISGSGTFQVIKKVEDAAGKVLSLVKSSRERSPVCCSSGNYFFPISTML